jgi:hypothetical protein
LSSRVIPCSQLVAVKHTGVGVIAVSTDDRPRTDLRGGCGGYCRLRGGVEATGLPLAGATDSSVATHRLKISKMREAYSEGREVRGIFSGWVVVQTLQLQISVAHMHLSDRLVGINSLSVDST